MPTPTLWTNRVVCFLRSGAWTYLFLGLREKHELLDDKIAVMSLVEHVFNRSADDRNIPFADIAKACDKPLEKVSSKLSSEF